MIRKILGSIFFLFGLIGFVIEISNYFNGKSVDNFGIVFAIILIFIGILLFYFGSKKKKYKNSNINKVEKKDSKNIKKENHEIKPSRSSIKVISIFGIIFSIINLLTGIIVILSGGVLLSSLFSKSESGWGLLGFGVSFLGVIIIILGFIRLIGYINLKQTKYAGFLIIFIFELLSVFYKTYLIIEGYWILFILPLIWSIFVVSYIYRNKSKFS